MKFVLASILTKKREKLVDVNIIFVIPASGIMWNIRFPDFNKFVVLLKIAHKKLIKREHSTRA